MAETHTGVIKSYGLKKGFGFITSEEFPGEEVFFSNRILPREVLDSFNDRSGIQLAGKTVSFTVTQNDNGKLAAGEVALVVADGEDSVGKVKSYNPNKGYGFLTSASVEGDIFFTKRDLAAHCQHMNIAGASATFKLVVAEDGKPQANQVSPQGMMGAMAALPWPGMGMAPGIPMAWSKGGGFGGGCGGKGMGGGGCWKAPERDRPMHGVVKNFDDNRGFGFIHAPEIPRDIYFQGQGSSFSQGDRVSFYLNYTPDGKPQARGVSPGFTDGESLTGTVKSYNAANGFGFVQVPDRPGDVYFKKECLPAHLQEEVLSGRTATVVVHLAHDGKPQAQQMDVLDGEAPPRQGIKRAAVDGVIRPMAKRAKVAEDVDDSYVDPSADIGSELEGTVKSYNLNTGWGFIKTHHLPQDVYFKGHHPEAAPGTRVRFQLAYTPDGKPQGNSLTFPHY